MTDTKLKAPLRTIGVQQKVQCVSAGGKFGPGQTWLCLGGYTTELCYLQCYCDWPIQVCLSLFADLFFIFNSIQRPSIQSSSHTFGPSTEKKCLKLHEKVFIFFFPTDLCLMKTPDPHSEN